VRNAEGAEAKTGCGNTGYPPIIDAVSSNTIEHETSHRVRLLIKIQTRSPLDLLEERLAVGGYFLWRSVPETSGGEPA